MSAAAAVDRMEREGERYRSFARAVRARGVDAPAGEINGFMVELCCRLYAVNAATKITDPQFASVMTHVERGDLDQTIRRRLSAF
jgi:hypothetical protein